MTVSFETTVALPQQVGYSLGKGELLNVLFGFLDWKLFLFRGIFIDKKLRIKDY